MNTRELANPIDSRRPGADAPLPSQGADARIPALDGLRGIAILLVMFYHATHVFELSTDNVWERLLNKCTSLGWSGVDMFFVLSGFLITGILLDTKNAPGYFGHFYIRRILRIFPLYYGVLFVFVVMLKPFSSAQPLHEFHAWLTHNQIWYWSYTENWLMVTNGFRGLNWLGHFWSLGVEEQFYMVWPLAIYLLPRTWVRNVCIFAIIGALALRILAVCVMPFNDAFRINFLLTITRLDGLSIGALAAMVVRTPGMLVRVSKYALPLVLATGCCLAVIGFLWFSRYLMMTVGYTLFAFFFGGVLLIALSSRRGHFAARWLSSGPLTFIGRISYGMYVFHYSVMILVMLLWNGIPWDKLGIPLARQLSFITVSGLLTVFVAFLSWHGVEKRFLALKSRFAYRGKDDKAMSAIGARA